MEPGGVVARDCGCVVTENEKQNGCRRSLIRNKEFLVLLQNHSGSLWMTLSKEDFLKLQNEWTESNIIF